MPAVPPARARAAVAALLVGAGTLAVACARQPVTPDTVAEGTLPPSGGTVTTRAGTTTTRKPPPTTAPPATAAPGTTITGPVGTVKAFDVSTDVSVDVVAGDTFELHVENDLAGEFTWKADITGEQVQATGLRTDPAPAEGKPTVLVGVYKAGQPGSATVTFSSAKKDGSPGKQFKVTVRVI